MGSTLIFSYEGVVVRRGGSIYESELLLCETARQS